MARKHALLTLDEICEEFDYLLWDTCALMHFVEIPNNTSNNFKKRIISKEVELSSYIFFNKYFKSKTNSFVTQEVFEEIRMGNAGSIRETLKKYGNLKLSRSDYKYFNKLCSTTKAKKELLKILKNRIIVLDDDEKREYFCSFQENLYLLEREYIINGRKKRIGEIDYNMLITLETLSKLRGKTALFSNDHPLLCSGNFLMNRKGLSEEYFACFRRDKEKYFSRFN